MQSTELNRPPYIDVYAQLLAASAEIDNHESDLYVKATPETCRIVRQSGWYATTFRSPVDGTPWIEIPFAYTPFWTRRSEVKP